ncbi:MAG: ABC transporter ATP-binding protein [Myxococcales bacterium]|nr:ABC transporter ATP-binding protein [Myxococcales bacterium]
MIEIRNLTKRFGSYTAVADLSLEIPDGEIFGFLGPNGAGKTTTIKIMAGLMRPNAGLVRIEGVDLMADPRRAKELVGYVPDRPFLYDKLSARETLSFTAGLFGVEPARGRERAEELLALFALLPWADELVESYSHGMKQRLTLACALLHRPRVLLVDEPMVGLDPRGALLVKELLRRFAAGGGTVFLSTHSLEVAEELCQRVGILHQGRLCALGTPEELRRSVGTEAGGRLAEVFLRLTGGAEMPGNLGDLAL